MPELALLALVCSRLCHDLVGPVGAVNNGAELLADGTEDGELTAQSLALIADSAADLAERLRFFRAAFGAGGGDQPMAADEMAAIARDWLARRRIRLELQAAPELLPRPFARRLLLLLLIGAEALPRGGSATLVLAGGGARLALAGDRLRFGDDLKAALDPGTAVEGLEARAAPAALLGRLAAQAGGRVTVDQDAAGLVLAL